MASMDSLRELEQILSIPEEVIIRRASILVPPKCPVCGSTSLVRIGGVVKANGLRIQRFRCKSCGRTFTELEGTPLKGLHDLKFSLVVAYLYLCLKVEPGAIAKMTGRSFSTVSRLVGRVKNHRSFFVKLLESLGVTVGTRCKV